MFVIQKRVNGVWTNTQHTSENRDRLTTDAVIMQAYGHDTRVVPISTQEGTK